MNPETACVYASIYKELEDRSYWATRIKTHEQDRNRFAILVSELQDKVFLHIYHTDLTDNLLIDFVYQAYGRVNFASLARKLMDDYKKGEL